MKRLTKKEIKLLKRTKSEKILKYLRDKTNLGKIKNSDADLKYTGPCGETMKLYLKIKNKIIEEAKFQYEGCVGVACCGSALCELIKGKTIQEAKKITQKDVLKHLEVSPIKDFDCPLLAVKTLGKAIQKYKIKKNEK